MATKSGKTSRRFGKLSSGLIKRKLSFSVVAAVILAFGLGIVGGYVVGKSHAATACVYGTYGYGASGPCVHDVQKILNSWNGSTLTGFHAAYSNQTDGIYGSNTQRDVELFQSWCNSRGGHAGPGNTGKGCVTINSKNLTVDGVVGEQTWYAMCVAALQYNYNYDDAGCAARWFGN